MRIVPAPPVGGDNQGHTAMLMATVHELSAEVVKLKSEAGKVQVKQVIVDRKVDNPALLETIEQQKKQIEALEKARLQALASRPAPQVITKEIKVPTALERIVFRTPGWVIPAIISCGALMGVIGAAVGFYVGKR